MNVRKLISGMIRENLGDMRFPSGAMTPQAHALINFVNSDAELFDLALVHGDDKKLMFDRAVASYEKRFNETLSGDRETVYYDFMAHYKKPGTIAAAEHIFGGVLGSKVIFDQSLGNTKFTIHVDRDFVPTAQQLADRAGYSANIWGKYDRGASSVLMKVIKQNDQRYMGSEL